MKITKVNTVESTLSNKDHPYMQGAWETFYDEFNENLRLKLLLLDMWNIFPYLHT